MRAPAEAPAVLAALVLALPFGALAGGEGPGAGAAPGAAASPEAAAGQDGGGGVRSSPTAHTVEIRGMAFRPARLRVAPGDTVVWVNRDVVPHTATSEPGGWDSGVLEQGDRWSRVMEGGDAAYVCRFHPAMEGRLETEGHPAGKGGGR